MSLGLSSRIFLASGKLWGKKGEQGGTGIIHGLKILVRGEGADEGSGLRVRGGTDPEGVRGVMRNVDNPPLITTLKIFSKYI